MAATAAEAQVEPDPSATSIGNDQTVKEATNPDSSAAVEPEPTESEDVTKAKEDAAEREYTVRFILFTSHLSSV